MNTKEPVRFFLGAYSTGGFYSLYDWLINLRAARGVYILKGGPGSGKQAFLRRVSDRLSENGAPQEIVSPLDPERCDGVLFPSLGAAFVDGDAPHIVEPRYPGAVERLIALEGPVPAPALRLIRGDIIRLAGEREQCAARATRCLAAARSLYDDIFSLVIPGANLAGIAKRARGAAAREIKPAHGFSGELKKRFLSAVTAAGPVCLFETARAMCGRIYEISDDYGLSHFFLTPVLNAAQQAGCGVYACYCPLNPEKKLEHVLIPELSVGFVTSDSLYPYDGKPYRRVRLNPAVNPELLRNVRQRLRFEKKTAASLISEAAESLKQMARIDRALECIYNPDGRFEKAERYAEDSVRELAQIPEI